MITGFRRFAQLLSASLAVGSMLAMANVALSQQIVRERIRPAFPEINFTERQLVGRAAVDRLGARLPEIASWYGTSAEQFRKQLLFDRGMRIDSKGRLFVVEEMEAPLQAVTTGAPQNVVDGLLSPLEQTFQLHSKPGSNRTIYLDFDGAALTGTAWNSGSGTIYAKPFDIDGNAAAFSTAELERIQYIWQRVAEDYAAFDVDVTTQAPTPDRLSRSDANDQIFGTTVLITHNSGVYNCSCGGIAYVGVFNSTTEKYKPALVFYNMLGNGSEKAVAEAASHEAGHNMGLSHDGNASTAYYAGQGTDALTGWAPIMGVGYYKPLVQFSRGEYAGASNKEDDFAVAQSYGLPLRADDYGSSIYAAAPFPGPGGTQDGIIERASDVDVFSISAAAGTFTAALSPAGRSANADLVLTLMNSAGAVLATSNPQNALNAAITYQIPATGTYYIAVRGTGQGDPLATGYTAYGSVGNFRLTAAYTGATGAAPRAVLNTSATSGIAPAAITLDGSQSTDSDGTVSFYYWDFGDGTGDTTGTLKSVTKTYATPGVYTVRLTVVDNSGFRSSATQSISVASAAPVNTVSVQSITLSMKVSRSGVAKVKAVVVVVNQLGQVMSNASVTGTWSGVVTSSKVLKTKRGKVTFNSPGSSASGCFVLTITGISLTGYSFNGAQLPTNQVCR
ncbi:PKD domain-containing protein [Aestuariivirga litoralis]|uniref:PKD domain-containing protein n=1 Tax=Aestuariivirga litoralis TaxID=2650924 RepID=A0A2W2CDZ9_9HYPH|nr:PKD domain-containing protein [Aestuariivirga litoralis]PZF78473.1 PKD domain-containing protein [Aestuariivirga litoralis]